MRTITLMLAVVLMLAGVSTVVAQEETTYDDLVGMFGDWTREDVEGAGYQVEEVCVNAEAAGAPAELGGMGFHAVNPSLVGDNTINPTEPEVILLDGDDNVIGVEYELLEVVDDPPTVAGQALKVTPPHPGMDHEHMSLHVYFVGDEEHRFSDFNPAVTCPEGSTMPPETMPETGITRTPNALLALLLAAAAAAFGGGLYLRRAVHV